MFHRRFAQTSRFLEVVFVVSQAVSTAIVPTWHVGSYAPSPPVACVAISVGRGRPPRPFPSKRKSVGVILQSSAWLLCRVVHHSFASPPWMEDSPRELGPFEPVEFDRWIPWTSNGTSRSSVACLARPRRASAHACPLPCGPLLHPPLEKKLPRGLRVRLELSRVFTNVAASWCGEARSASQVSRCSWPWPWTWTRGSRR